MGYKRSLAFLLHSNGFGGYEARMFKLIEWLLENTKFKFILITNNTILQHYQNKFPYLSERNSRVKIICFDAKFNNFFDKINNVIKLNYQILKNLKSFDLLIGAEYLKNVAWICKFKPVIFNIVHPNFFRESEKKNILMKYITSFLLKHSNKIDFLNPYIYKKIMKEFDFLDKNKYSVSPCSFIEHTNKGLKDIKKRKKIMWMGSFEEQKQPMILLRAIKEISSILRKNDYSVEFYGKGSLENSMKKYIELNNLNDLVKIGFVKNTHDILEEASVFVSSQKYTNYPSQVLLEAMDNYCIPIASDVPDTHLLVTPKNGFLFNDYQELSNILENLIKENGAKIKKMRLKSQTIARRHNIKRYSKHFINLINN